MTNTNIKNLPAGEYITEYGHSQSYAYKVIGRSASGKTLTVAAVYVKLDPEWQENMEVYPGGFCAHIANQSEQTWLFDKIANCVQKIRVGTKKAARNWSDIGNARHFYDYNF